MTLRHLDLFSGIGGFALAARMVGGIETQQFCEIDPYCQKVLAKNFPGVPIHGDVTTFVTADRYDLVTFGSPCQDISCANTDGRGLEGERSGLFYEAIRILRMVHARFAVFENVANILTKDGGRHFESVLRAFYESGFDAEWQIISAASVGAPHLRERIFVVAYSNGIRRDDRVVITRSAQPIYQRTASPWTTTENCSLRSRLFEPMPLRVAHGLPNRMDRIKGCGNAIVPQVGAIALQRVLELEAAS